MTLFKLCRLIKPFKQRQTFFEPQQTYQDSHNQFETMQSKFNQFNKRHPQIAYLYALLAYALMAVSQSCIKVINSTMSPFAVFAYRGMLLLVAGMVINSHNQQSFNIKSPKVFRSVIERVVFAALYSGISFYCLKYLPVGTNLTLQNTAPILAFFVEAFLFRKPLSKILLVLTCICFTGVVLIIQPSFLFGYDKDSSLDLFIGLLALFGAFCFATQTAGSVSKLVNLCYSYISHIFMGTLMGNFMEHTIDFDLVTLFIIFLWVVLIASSLSSHFLLVLANQLQQTSKIMPLGYSGLLVGFAVDTFYFQVSYNLLSMFGLIMASVGLLSKICIAEAAQKSQNSHRDVKLKESLQ